MRKILAIALASMLVALSMTSVAFAQSSVDGYSPDDGAVQNQIEGNDDDSGTAPNAQPNNESESGSPTAAAAPSNDSGSLPFTGLDLALLAGAGAVLLGLGLGMRHLTRSPGSTV